DAEKRPSWASPRFASSSPMAESARRARRCTWGIVAVVAISAGCRSVPPDVASGAASQTEERAEGTADGFIEPPGLDDLLVAQMQAAQSPGMAVAIVKGSHVSWTKGYGVADLTTNRPVTADTQFMLASISKTVTSVALMSLIEDPRRNLSL